MILSSAMRAKRIFDVAVSGTGLVLLSPIFAVVAAANAAHFKMNPIFLDDRIGKGGENFKILKFRSMHHTTDAEGNLLPDRERRSRLGSFLKMTAIDELPQLFNILRGDMSIVGPRPITPDQFEAYIPEEYREAIISVQPGLTGPWQVASIGRHTSMSREDRYRLDASYAMDGISFLKDMCYIIRTPRTFLHGHNGIGLKIPNSFEKLEADSQQ